MCYTEHENKTNRIATQCTRKAIFQWHKSSSAWWQVLLDVKVLLASLHFLYYIMFDAVAQEIAVWFVQHTKKGKTQFGQLVQKKMLKVQCNNIQSNINGP
uniref:Uncharacterized protein n=1 Tax=Octopus bimaculoides TaxID=37653 RepID=A0A0L8HP59_OCTBM